MNDVSDLGGFLFFGVGLFQAFPIAQGVLTDLPCFLHAPVALMLGSIPLVGHGLAMFGSVEAWGWPWGTAGAVFGGILCLQILLLTFSD